MLEEVKGISDALWESLDCQVGTLERKIDVHGSRSSKTPQSTEQIVVIKEAQKQLRDVIKALMQR